MELENLLLEVEDRIALLTVNRPAKLNALNRDTLKELDQACSSLGANGDVGAVILTGAGDKAFVAGADIGELAAMGPA